MGKTLKCSAAFAVCASRCQYPGVEEIIDRFKHNDYLEGLARTVFWGGMARASKWIYAPGRERIGARLAWCAESIDATQSIAGAWNQLTEPQFGWSAVMASKTLHFLSRARGFEENPPVPIDNRVILERVWPQFKKSTRLTRGLGWRGASFEAYARYMTAVSVWADQRGWTTTEVEATIFDNFR